MEIMTREDVLQLELAQKVINAYFKQRDNIKFSHTVRRAVEHYLEFTDERGETNGQAME